MSRIRSVGFIPYCIAPLTDEDTGAGTGFPVAVPLDSLASPMLATLMKWARRVRKWDITITSTVHGSVSFTLEDSGELNEWDRICAIPAMTGQSVTGGVTTTAQIEFRPQSPHLTLGAVQDGADFYPAMAVSLTISGGGGPTLAVSSKFSASDYTFSGAVDGETIIFGGLEDPAHPGEQVTGVDVEPLEYFAFADENDAEPILSTTSGGIILPPFDYPPSIP